MKKITLIVLLFVLVAVMVTSCSAPAITAENSSQYGTGYVMYRIVDKQNSVICYFLNSSTSPFCLHLDKISGGSGAVPNE